MAQKWVSDYWEHMNTPTVNFVMTCKHIPYRTQEPKEHHKRTQELMKQILRTINKGRPSKTTHGRKVYKRLHELEINQNINTKAESEPYSRHSYVYIFIAGEH